ncbi:MAG: hypothetical protein RLZZ59_687 [Pseudomonadota bacterium]|jgi:BirA family biotin operon repressor/biotin-[acetyl-CoA-carboxylase] ligase
MNHWLEKYDLLAFDDIGSTNDEAKNIVLSTGKSNIVLWAKTQYKGRGRYDRNWVSSEGNLYMSIIKKVSCDLATASQLSFVIGLAVYDSIAPLLQNKHLSLKWPNDIMIEDSKVGGILLESVTHNNELYIIIGVGLNIQHAPDKISTATSLNNHGIDVSPAYLLSSIIEKLEILIENWFTQGFQLIREKWLKSSYKLGEVVTIGSDNKRATGIFESINEEGGIVLKIASGEKYVLSTGEVFF